MDHFDLLAVCMFNQTRKWELYFIAGKHLKRAKDAAFLAIFQPVPFNPSTPWEKDLSAVLREIARDRL